MHAVRPNLKAHPNKLNCFPVQLQVDVSLWVSSKHNMGMAFTRKLWEEVRSCRAYFCNFDDYNWDWSLYHVSLMCLEKRMKVMLVKAPRVFHIGEW